MAAPKGNKYAEGNNGGRPPVWDSLELLDAAIQSYFDQFILNDDEERSDNPSVTGLALFLGFASKQSIYDYKDNKVFSYSIKRALLVIENHYEQGLNGKSPTGSIFALKNMGWKDKSETEHSGSIAVDADPFKQIRENSGIDDSD